MCAVSVSKALHAVHTLSSTSSEEVETMNFTHYTVLTDTNYEGL